MSKLKIYGIPLFVLGLFGTVTVSAQIAHEQSYVDKMLSHKITVHYPDHMVIATVKPIEGVPLESSSIYYWFSGNQINTTQGGYSGKLLNGIYEDFYANKSLKESGSFAGGLKAGIWKSWTDNGVLKEEYTYQQGKKNGAYIRYDLNGKPTARGSYQSDLLNGKQETFAGDSSLVVYYKQGKVKERKSIIPKFIYKILPKKSAPKKNP